MSTANSTGADPRHDKQDIVLRLRKIRRHLRLSGNRELAAFLGVQPETVDGWVKKKRPLSLTAARAVEVAERLCEQSAVARPHLAPAILNEAEAEAPDYWGYLALWAAILDARIGPQHRLGYDSMALVGRLRDAQDASKNAYPLVRFCERHGLDEDAQNILAALLILKLGMPRRTTHVKWGMAPASGHTLLLGVTGKVEAFGRVAHLLTDDGPLIKNGLVVKRYDAGTIPHSLFEIPFEIESKLMKDLPPGMVPPTVYEDEDEGNAPVTPRQGNDPGPFPDGNPASFVAVPPTVSFSAVVLPEDVRTKIDRVIALVNHRELLLETWCMRRCFQHGEGAAALFHGEPGTGKTLCAEALAAEIGKRIIFATTDRLVDMWLGSTDKNIVRLFQSAREQDAVLFLDEADSFLCTREYARQGFEVKHVNTILREIERHSGLVILATNFKPVLDGALKRRLVGEIEFTRPGPREREKLWRIHLPSAVPTKGKIDFQALARFDLTGGEIKNAVVAAVADAVRLAGKKAKIRQDDLVTAAVECAPVVRRVGFAPS